MKMPLTWGYEIFYRSGLGGNPVVARLARWARDVVFTAMVWKDGVANERIVETDVHHGRMYVDLADNGVSRTLYINGLYEPGLTEACSTIAEPGMTVVDVGANIGYFTIPFSEIVGDSGKVYAFEADPRNADVLERNIRLRDCSNVEVSQVAVSDTSSDVEFQLSDDQFSRSRILDSSNTTETVDEVETVTLDQELSESVDLLKVDVVGAELKILRGAMGLIEQSKPRIVLPHLPHKWGDEQLSVFEDLAEMGYTRWSLEGEDLGSPTERPKEPLDPSVVNVVYET